MTGYDDKLDLALDTAMSGILAKLEAAFDPDLGLADIYARSTRREPYPAPAVAGRDSTGSSRLEVTCDQIDMLTAWLADLIRSGEREPFGGSSFLELARENLIALRAGLAARIMARPEAQRLASDAHSQLGQADRILRSQHATTLDHLASANSQLLIGHYQATVYQENGGWVGAISLGFDGQGKRQRIKRNAKTKTELKEKLITVVAEREAGLKTSANYTVGDAVQDWLAKGLRGRDPDTIRTNRILIDHHLLPLIGGIKLTELTADDVDNWLEGRSGQLATNTLQRLHANLKRSIRHAQARDRVMRNVAELVSTPKGRGGRPSKAMAFEQAMTILEHARQSRWYAYVVVSLLTGIRTEEARALRWSLTDSDCGPG